MSALLFAIAFCNQFGCYRENSTYSTMQECEAHVVQSYVVNGERVKLPVCIKVGEAIDEAVCCPGRGR